MWPETDAPFSRCVAPLWRSFLDDIDRIASRSYTPSDADVVRARLRTIGIQEHSLVFEDGVRVSCSCSPLIPVNTILTTCVGRCSPAKPQMRLTGERARIARRGIGRTSRAGNGRSTTSVDVALLYVFRLPSPVSCLLSPLSSFSLT